jgi:hypothetical protein
MYDDPDDQQKSETASDAQTRAAEKAEELRQHAEIAAIFEGPRKFDAELHDLNAETARDVQRRLAKLAKAKQAGSHQLGAVLPPELFDEAAHLLDLHETSELPTNDYHIYRRPGEVMIFRWLANEDEISSFYERMQAHFDAALEGTIEDEEGNAWKNDETASAYRKALEALQYDTAGRYLREPMRKHDLFVMNTLSADAINILFLTDSVMGTGPAAVVGDAFSPPDNASESQLSWFFKLFSLRGSVEKAEKMLFFAFLQKTDDEFTFDTEE